MSYFYFKYLIYIQNDAFYLNYIQNNTLLTMLLLSTSYMKLYSLEYMFRLMQEMVFRNNNIVIIINNKY